MKTIKVYADTSVFGGVFDKEFISPSHSFFEQVRSGLITLFTSALVQEEISYAPVKVRDLFSELIEYMEILDVSEAHIVHFKKITSYNTVNILEGYSQISIYSPSEVIRYD